MLRVSDSARPGHDSLDNAVHRVAFPLVQRGRHPKEVISELNGWPALPPVNASRAASRMPAHDSGPQWSSYSFRVGLFHPLPYAGFIPALSGRPLFTEPLMMYFFRVLVAQMRNWVAW
jgi:hypothetical protein